MERDAANSAVRGCNVGGDADSVNDVRLCRTSELAFVHIIRVWDTQHGCCVGDPATALGRGLGKALRRGCAAAEDDFDAVLDASLSASMASEARSWAQANSIDELIAELLPPHKRAPEEARSKLREYFTAKPINNCIRADRIIITHVQDMEGRDERAQGMSPMTLEAALTMAKDNQLDLVQMAFNEKDGYSSSFCRLRREREAAMATIQSLLPQERGAVVDSAAATAAAEANLPLKEVVHHVFRDAVDAHFIGWKSKKIVGELRRRTPIRLSIEKFVSATAAVRKMREMLDAIKTESLAAGLHHHHTGINASERELAVFLSPTLKSKNKEVTVKHPSDDDWNRALQRLHTALGGKGTVRDDKKLKPRNVGLTTYRKDKYGRRIE
jgi:hypothetical protein